MSLLKTLLYRNWDNCAALSCYFLEAHYTRWLDSASHQYLYPLHLCKFLSVIQELLHAVVVIDFEKFFKRLIDTKLLFLVRQQAHVHNRNHVLRALQSRTPHDNYEVLLSLRTKFKSDPLCQFFAYWVLDKPAFMLYLRVDNSFLLIFVAPKFEWYRFWVR